MTEHNVKQCWRNSNVDRVEVIQVIHVVSLFGDGVYSDPARTIHEYYNMDGELLSRKDPLGDLCTGVENPS